MTKSIYVLFISYAITIHQEIFERADLSRTRDGLKGTMFERQQERSDCWQNGRIPRTSRGRSDVSGRRMDGCVVLRRDAACCGHHASLCFQFRRWDSAARSRHWRDDATERTLFFSLDWRCRRRDSHLFSAETSVSENNGRFSLRKGEITPSSRNHFSCIEDPSFFRSLSLFCCQLVSSSLD